MEPSSLAPRRRGTLENPEVLEDVPGHIIPILEREFDDFDTEATKFLAGDTEETEFIKFRLKQGVYGQRQAAVQMVRVKLPFGGVTPDQMDACWADKQKVADLVATFQKHATEDKIDGTPSFVIGGEKVQNQPWEDMKKIIDAKLAEAGKQG